MGIRVVSDDACQMVSQDCPARYMCSGSSCMTKQDGWGSFDDPHSTPAYGCYLTMEGKDFNVPDRSGICASPSSSVASELASIPGWSSGWSGHNPPWSYNTNRA